MPKFLTREQNDAEWLAVRTGRITASCLKHVMDFNQPSAAQAKEAGFKLVREAVAAGIVGEMSAAQDKYFWDTIGERMTRKAAEHHVTAAMQWGMNEEYWAIEAYKLAFDVKVERVGFCVHSVLDYSGASPDGIVGTTGMIEAKCPNTVTHLKWRDADVVPDAHKAQMYWGMACAEREWCDFISFDSRVKNDRARVFCKRLERDDAIIKTMQARVMAFNDRIEEKIAHLCGTKPRRTLNCDLRESVKPSPEPKFTSLIDIAASGLSNSELPAWARR